MIEGKVSGYFLVGENPVVGHSTAGCSGSGWPTSTGSSSVTCR